MSLKTLSACTSILFIISIFVFIQENKRGTDLLSGSDYIKGLDINKIQKIVLRFKDDKKITLSRDSNKFVLEDHKSYPAATVKVNDLIYKIASIQVKEKVADGASEEDLKRYELDEKGKHYQIELYDDHDKKTISFRVGKSPKGNGHYLFREDKKDVYLSQSNLWINSSYKDFINTVLLKVKKENISQVHLESDTSIQLAKKENKFVIESHNNKKLKDEKANEYVDNISDINFEDYFAYSDPKVQGLNFDNIIKIQLNNNLIYRLSLAKNKDSYYAKLNALVEDTQTQFVISKDDGKDKLKNIEDVIKAQSEAQRVNMEKGNWVFKVDKSIYEKLVKDSSYFM